MFGGDQLTVARARGAQHAQENSVDGFGRLDRLISVCEDWHACSPYVCMSVSPSIQLIVIYKWQYGNVTSSKDEGIQGQLRNLTQRNLPQNPKNDVQKISLIWSSCSFCYNAVLKIKELNEVVSSLSVNLANESSSRKNTLYAIVNEVVDQFLNIELFSSSAQERLKRCMSMQWKHCLCYYM